MPNYNPTFDLRGKRIQDTYQQVLEYDSASNYSYNGLGYQIFLSASTADNATSASYALNASNADTASFALNATPVVSCSWASQSLSASWAPSNGASANFASASLSASWASQSLSASLATLADGVVGLNIVDTPSVLNSSITFGVSDHTNQGTLVDSVLTNETFPHATIKVNNKLYGGGWTGHLFVLNDPDGDITNITTASFIGGNWISQVAYSAGTGYLYFICGNSTGVATGSIVRVDPNNISNQKVIVQGLPGGSGSPPSGPAPLPGLAADNSYLYTIEGSTIYKYDIVTGIQVASSPTSGISHAGGVFSQDGQTLYFSAGHTVTKINVSTLSSSINAVPLTFTYDGSSFFQASLSDDMALLNGSIYVVQDASQGDFGLWKVDANALTWTPYKSNTNWSPSGSWAYPTAYGGYGVFTDTQHIYVLQGSQNEIWIYLNGNLDNGPTRFAVTGNPNELWITDGGYFVYTNWTTNQIYRYRLPLIEVGIDKVPQYPLDVAGITNTTTLIANVITSSVIVAGTASIGDLTYTNAFSSPFGLLTFDRYGNIFGEDVWINDLTASYNISASGFVSASGFFGTASNAISASWAPGSSAVSSVSASWASQSLNTVSASWASQSLNSATASWANNYLKTGSLYPITTSWALYSVTSSYITQSVLSSSFASSSFAATSASWASQSLYALSASWASSSVASVSSSWTSASISSSYAGTASILLGSIQSATYALSASWASQSLSATSASWASQSLYALSASWASQSLSATSASWASQSFSASYLSGSKATASFLFGTASNAVSASWAPTGVSTTAVSASWASASVTASYLLQNGGNTLYSAGVLTSGRVVSMNGATLDNSSIYDNLSSNVSIGGVTSTETLHIYGNIYATTITSSVITSSFSGSLNGTASNAVSASWTVQAASASYLSGSVATASFLFGTASWANTAVATTSASWASQSLSASYLSASVATASFLFGTASYAVSSSHAITASWSSASLSASFAQNCLTAAYSATGGGGGGNLVYHNTETYTENFPGGASWDLYTGSLKYTPDTDGMYRINVVMASTCSYYVSGGVGTIYFSIKLTNPNESYLIYDNIVVTPGFGYTSAGPISLDYTGYGTYFFSQLFYAKSGHEIEWYYDSNGGNIATSNMTFITKVAVEKLVGVTT